MNEQSNQGNATHDENNVIALLTKIQDHLIILERKIEALSNKPQERSFPGKPFSKPFRSFGPPRRHDRGDRDNRRSGGGYDRGDRGDRGGREHDDRRGGQDQGRPYRKHSGSDSRTSVPKGKPFYNKYKNKSKSY